MKTKTKLHFARFEFKYLLGKGLRDEIEKELQYFMEFDPFVENKPDYKYFVRSLYFDDPCFSAYYDKTDGLHTRSKFRIRTYTEDSNDDIPKFLELKGRYNNLVFKHRVRCHIYGERAHQGGGTWPKIFSNFRIRQRFWINSNLIITGNS